MSPHRSSLRLAASLLVVLASAASLCSGQSLFQGTGMVNPGGGSTATLVVGLFNADTHPDIAVAMPSGGPCGVSVLLGNGNGTFSFAGVFFGAGGGCPYGMALGDFNADGKKDLATANELSNSVSILIGSGTGTFTAQPELSAGDTPRYLAAADLNGDGKADLAAANQFSDNVSVFMGNGNGTFQPQVTYPVDELPRGIVAADFNSDSKPDLAVATRTGGSLSVLIGNGNGTFQPQVTIPLDNLGRPSPLLTGDLDADGKADLVVGADSSRSVSVEQGHGDGSFDPSFQYLTSPQMGSPVDIAKGNFNGDGAPDLVSAEYFTNIASVLLGVGNGSFAPHLTFPSGFTNPIAPMAVATGDFNSDGFDDIVLGSESNSLSILMNQKPFPGSCSDSDGDGFGSPGDPSCSAGALTDCNDAASAISPLAVDPCDGVDNNCDSRDGFDQDVDTFTTCGGDCNDLVSSIRPGAREFCNGIDEDCNGVVDVPAEEATGLSFGSSETSFSWSASTGFNVKYNVYRGTHASAGGFSYNQTCFLPAITTPSATDSQAPSAAQFFHYFVTGENSCGEGTPGSSSSSIPRPNSLPCP